MDSLPSQPPLDSHPPEKDEAPEPESPPLSIQHLFLWTTCLAIAAGIQTALHPRGDTPLAEWIGNMLVAIVAMGTGLFVCSLGLARRFYFSIPFPTEPGHWYGLCDSVSIGAQLVMFLLFNSLLSVSEIQPSMDSSYMQAVYRLVLLEGGLSLLVGTLMLIAAAQFTAWRLWQVFLCLSAGNYVLLAAYNLVSSISILLLGDGYFGMPILTAATRYAGHAALIALASAGVAALVAVVIDLRSGVRRDWLHYVGLVLLIARLLFLIPYAARMWFQPSL